MEVDTFHFIKYRVMGYFLHLYFIFALSTKLIFEIHIVTQSCTGVSDARVQRPTQLESADLRHCNRSSVTWEQL